MALLSTAPRTVCADVPVDASAPFPFVVPTKAFTPDARERHFARTLCRGPRILCVRGRAFGWCDAVTLEQQLEVGTQRTLIVLPPRGQQIIAPSHWRPPRSARLAAPFDSLKLAVHNIAVAFFFGTRIPAVFAKTLASTFCNSTLFYPRN